MVLLCFLVDFCLTVEGAVEAERHRVFYTRVLEHITRERGQRRGRERGRGRERVQGPEQGWLGDSALPQLLNMLAMLHRNVAVRPPS